MFTSEATINMTEKKMHFHFKFMSKIVVSNHHRDDQNDHIQLTK